MSFERFADLAVEHTSQHDVVSIASRLWSMLDEAHRDFNGIVRSNPGATVSETQTNVLNGLLQQIIRLLGEHEYARNLFLISREKVHSSADVLIILGQYKGALRAFRVDVLGEGQFTF